MSDLFAGPQTNAKLQSLLDQIRDGLISLQPRKGASDPVEVERILVMVRQAQTIVAFDAPPAQTSCPQNDPSCALYKP